VLRIVNVSKAPKSKEYCEFCIMPKKNAGSRCVIGLEAELNANTCVAGACCSELQCVAACCSVLQCVAMCGVGCCRVFATGLEAELNAHTCVAVCCGVLRGDAVCCSVMQCGAV